MGLFKGLEHIWVWVEAEVIPGHDPDVWRRDALGDVIKYSEYGNRDSAYGWEIDHITPSALGGPDTLSNKRALHWRNNCSAGGILGNALAEYRRRS